MPFHRQQPDTLSKPCAVYEHEGMSLCVCAELQLDNSTVTRHFNACPSRLCVTSPPPQPLRLHCRVWSRLDVELLVGCRLSTGLTLISVSFFPAQHICMSLCLFLLRPVRLCVLFLWFVCSKSNSMSLQLCNFSVPDPPEFRHPQPAQVQVVEDDTATLPLLLSANPQEVSCIWLHYKEKLVKGDPRLCDGSINQLLVELSQQVSTQFCHSGSE